ncbi:DUF1127 domain-containing protein [Agrobacterium sp. BA1120]|uniref:DUF1127 domain-containing protein n=1 Tax=Agrobacterium sp. BA1120 TaxID=3228927 RepID=UPI003369C941
MSVNNLSDHVDDLFSQFGAWATVQALFVVAWRRHRARVHVSHLSDHLRRDIGLPVHKKLSGEPLIPPWMPRF